MTVSNKVIILAENYAFKASLAEWGFSALIEINNEKYLFDVGYSGSCIIKNAKELGIELKDINGIILSHGHYDHTDGLEAVLNHIGPTKIYAHPNIFTSRYSLKDGNLEYSGIKLSKEELETKFGATFVFNDNFTKISDNLYMTGEVPFSNKHEKISTHFKVRQGLENMQDTFSDDNSVVIDTPKGAIIIFGCAHRGIVNIMNYVKTKTGKNIFGIIGGTHLHDVKKDHFKFIVDYIKQEEIELIAPGHCTGIDKIFDFKNIFKEKVTPAFCGEQFKIS